MEDDFLEMSLPPFLPDTPLVDHAASPMVKTFTFVDLVGELSQIRGEPLPKIGICEPSGSMKESHPKPGPGCREFHSARNKARFPRLRLTT